MRFFALDSNYIDDKQLDWLDKQLADSGSDWKICFFHHPPYSSGETHGSAVLQREKLEPVFVKHGVNVVLSGHEHFYERIKPQKGIQYFILGNSAKVRRGDLLKTDLTEKGFDQGYTFMLVEIAGDDLTFQTISDKGTTIDQGTIHRVGKTEPTPGRSAQPIQPGPAPKRADETVTAKGIAHDPQARFRRLSLVFAKSRSKNRTAPQSRERFGPAPLRRNTNAPCSSSSDAGEPQRSVRRLRRRRPSERSFILAHCGRRRTGASGCADWPTSFRCAKPKASATDFWR